jgi:orotidine-5'-phosphate decarboxylase
VTKTKVILAWDKPRFNPADEYLVQELLELGVIDGIKTGHVTDAVEDDCGVPLSSKIRSFVKDLVSQESQDSTAVYFNDQKYYDIGKTVVEATRHVVQCNGLGNRVDLLTFNPDISIEALRTVAKICADSGTTALLTTVLTDISLKEHRKRFLITPNERTVEVASLALDCGIRGIVCSGNELPILQRGGFVDELITVVPGIRPLWAAKRGQNRTMTPEQAAALGATYVVIGSPILEHSNPIEAATLIHQAIAAVGTIH